MSTSHPPVAPSGERLAAGARAVDTPLDEDRGAGWVMFAGIMISIVGVLNCIYGLAAIDNANFYIDDAKYILSDLNTWGWVVLLIGVAQLLAAFLIFSRNAFGRWVGVLTAAGNAVVQLMFLPSYPLAALAIFSIDILVIYGLVAYGGRTRATV
jgi:hypothetical protein